MKKIAWPVCILLLCSQYIYSQGSMSKKISIPTDYCINQEEYQLFNLVNNLRKSRGLPSLQLSKS